MTMIDVPHVPVNLRGELRRQAAASAYKRLPNGEKLILDEMICNVVDHFRQSSVWANETDERLEAIALEIIMCAGAYLLEKNIRRIKR